MIKDRLGARAVPIQIPSVARQNFSGIIDLINSREIVWKNDDRQCASLNIQIFRRIFNSEEFQYWRES